MWVPSLLELLLCAVGFILCTESPMWEYRFVDKDLTWSEGQQFCRQHYHDLACVSSSEDNLRLPRPPSYSAPVWIGLYDDPTDLSQWKWTASNSSISFMAWSSAYKEPRYIHNSEAQQCGVGAKDGWHSDSCSTRRRALCFSGSSPKVFHLSSSYMSWFDALAYCRTNYDDLALIESTEENAAALSFARYTNYMWMGLHRFKERWSDNTVITFSKWYNLGGKKVYQEPFCVAENVHNSWVIASCQEKRPFYCQAEPKSRRFVKIAFSGHDLGASVINQDVLEELHQMFQAEGRTDVEMKWKAAPEKQATRD